MSLVEQTTEKHFIAIKKLIYVYMYSVNMYITGKFQAHYKFVEFKNWL